MKARELKFSMLIVTCSMLGTGCLPLASETDAGASSTNTTPATLTVESYNFESVAVGSSAETRIEIGYSGTDTATAITVSGLSGVFAYVGGTYPGTGGTCGTTITTPCTLALEFTPTTETIYEETLTVTYGGGTETTATAQLSGLGATQSVIAFASAPAYAFGNVASGTSVDATLTVQFVGTTIPAIGIVESGITAPYTFKGGTYPGTGGTCGESIDTSCTVVITFAPTAAGANNQTLKFTYNNGITSTSTSILLTGTGT